MRKLQLSPPQRPSTEELKEQIDDMVERLHEIIDVAEGKRPPRSNHDR